MKVFVVLGSGTNVGKTYIMCQMIDYLKNAYGKAPKKIFAIKPVISGFYENPCENQESDLTHIAAALAEEALFECLQGDVQNSYQNLSLYRLSAPLSPNIAAKYEGVELNYEDIIAFCQQHIVKCKALQYNYLFIETAGGAFSPLTKTKTCLDLASELQKFCRPLNTEVETILIANNYLGTISHSVSAIKLARPNYFLFNNNSNDNFAQEVFKNIQSFTAPQRCFYLDGTTNNEVYNNICGE